MGQRILKFLLFCLISISVASFEFSLHEESIPRDVRRFNHTKFNITDTFSSTDFADVLYEAINGLLVF